MVKHSVGAEYTPGGRGRKQQIERGRVEAAQQPAPASPVPAAWLLSADQVQQLDDLDGMLPSEILAVIEALRAERDNWRALASQLACERDSLRRTLADLLGMSRPAQLAETGGTGV